MVKIKVGIRLKELRTNEQLSQEKLALLSNIDRTYITSVENGKRNISIGSLNKLLLALNVTFKEFFETFDESITCEDQ